MEKIAKQVLLMVLCFCAVWLLALGLAAAVIAFMLKAVLISLEPVVGQANAYLLCALLCALPLLVAYVSIKYSSSFNKKAPNTDGGLSSDGVGQMIRDHPLEAVTVAFTLGFAMDDAEELKQVLRMAGKQVVKV
jgi:hypothetical protein